VLSACSLQHRLLRSDHGQEAILALSHPQMQVLGVVLDDRQFILGIAAPSDSGYANAVSGRGLECAISLHGNMPVLDAARFSPLGRARPMENY
jgi:hypothetical protein